MNYSLLPVRFVNLIRVFTVAGLFFSLIGNVNAQGTIGTTTTTGFNPQTGVIDCALLGKTVQSPCFYDSKTCACLGSSPTSACVDTGSSCVPAYYPIVDNTDYPSFTNDCPNIVSWSPDPMQWKQGSTFQDRIPSAVSPATGCAEQGGNPDGWNIIWDSRTNWQNLAYNVRAWAFLVRAHYNYTPATSATSCICDTDGICLPLDSPDTGLRCPENNGTPASCALQWSWSNYQFCPGPTGKLDWVPPYCNISLSPGAGSWTKGSVSAGVSCDDGPAPRSSGIASCGGGGTLSINGSVSGSATDKVGYAGSCSAIVWWIDKTPPILTNTIPPFAANHNKPILLDFTDRCGDNGENGCGGQAGVGAITASLTEPISRTCTPANGGGAQSFVYDGCSGDFSKAGNYTITLLRRGRIGVFFTPDSWASL